MSDTDIDLKAIQAVLAEMEKQPISRAKGPLTAQLVDENDPDGNVILVDDAGTIRYSMPRSVYDDLRAMDPIPADPVVEEPEKEDWRSRLENAPLREEVLYIAEEDLNDLRAWLLEGRLTNFSMGCKVAEDIKTKFDQHYKGIVPEVVKPCVPEFRPIAVPGQLRYTATQPYFAGNIPTRVDVPCEGPQVTRDWDWSNFDFKGETHVSPSFVKKPPSEDTDD